VPVVLVSVLAILALLIIAGLVVWLVLSRRAGSRDAA
jgi:hypothetical protein